MENFVEYEGMDELFDILYSVQQIILKSWPDWLLNWLIELNYEELICIIFIE